VGCLLAFVGCGVCVLGGGGGGGKAGGGGAERMCEKVVLVF